MQNHVPSLETSQKLKTDGFPQETYFCWAREWNKPQKHEHRKLLVDWVIATKHDRDAYGTKIERVAAPLLTEILEQFPDCLLEKCDGLASIQVREDYGDNHGSGYTIIDNGNPAEAAALLFIALKEG